MKNPLKWARFRELYGPSKIVEKFKAIICFTPAHTKLYATGPIFKMGHIIIPVMNIEMMLSEIWANVTLAILTKSPKRSRKNKIIINDHLLSLCFKFKVMLSINLFLSDMATFDQLHEKSDSVLGTRTNKIKFRKFLNTKGSPLAVVIDYAHNLGLNSCIKLTGESKFRIYHVQKIKISDFHKPENHTKFAELINLSSIGGCQLSKLNNHL
jgi:hypothetical protein